MPRQNVSDLLAFRAVARERSFTRAAAQIGVSTSALSHTIRGLEERLGIRLLTRTTRSVVPTEAGERLLGAIGPHFDGIEAELAALPQPAVWMALPIAMAIAGLGASAVGVVCMGFLQRMDPQAALLPARPRYRKDEAVIGLGRWFEDTFRIYGQAAYAFDFTDDRAGPLADTSKQKQRYQLGAEWFPWGLYCGSGFGGQPFVAVNGDFRGENNFSGDLTAQAGWLWRNPLQRLASLRVYAQYYSGRPVYGQFSRFERSHYGSIGVACDY